MNVVDMNAKRDRCMEQTETNHTQSWHVIIYNGHSMISLVIAAWKNSCGTQIQMLKYMFWIEWYYSKQRSKAEENFSVITIEYEDGGMDSSFMLALKKCHTNWKWPLYQVVSFPLLYPLPITAYSFNLQYLEIRMSGYLLNTINDDLSGWNENWSFVRGGLCSEIV